MTSNHEPILDIQGLTVTFTGGVKPVRAVDGVDLALRPGEVVALLGESGSGKSVTLRSVLRLHNEKKSAVQIRVVQGFWGAWKIESESVKSTRPDGATAQWLVPVPAGGEVVLKFAVVMG